MRVYEAILVVSHHFHGPGWLMQGAQRAFHTMTGQHHSLFFSFLFYPAFLSIAFPAPCPLSLHTQTDNKDREQCMPGVAVCTFQREREGVTMEGSTVGRGLVCYWTKKVVGGEVLICVHRRISHGAAKPGPPHINVQIHLVPEWTDPDAHLNPRRGGEAFRRLR